MPGAYGEDEAPLTYSELSPEAMKAVRDYKFYHARLASLSREREDCKRILAMHEKSLRDAWLSGSQAIACELPNGKDN